MNPEQSSRPQERDLLLEDAEPARVARYLALEREKDPLRRERDHLILDLAASLGPAALAQRFGVEPRVIAKLLAGARGRLNSAAGEEDRLGAEIIARRGRATEPRWLVADAHFEALGRASA
jgi:hypothetical protein